MSDLTKTHQITLSDKELNLFRQWFNSVQDCNPNYLNKEDYQTAANVYKLLGWRVPNSIVEKL